MHGENAIDFTLGLFMTHVRVEWTPELSSKLPVPDWLSRSLESDSANYAIFLDAQSMTALVVHPFDHASYPDQAYTLLVPGHSINIWETAPGSSKPHQIEAWLPSEIIGLDKEGIIATLLSAVAAFRGSPDQLPPISIRSI